MKAVIVTGASKGLGFEIKELLKKEYKVIGISRSSGDYTGDISDEAFVHIAINDIMRQYEVIGLVNCASEGFFAEPKDINAEGIDRCLNGLKGMMLVTGSLLKKKEEDLRIVNILSTAALKGKKMEAAYCTAKFGQRGYTESLKEAYKGTSVKVNGVYVGGMDTGFWDTHREYISVDKQKTFMNPQKVAKMIVDAYFVEGSGEDLHITR
ncbi:MAG: SDR family oxidoreductase [Clostridia bacterium]|nr:SDR family oxidoreductase [Clostridia bacterium]